jgi:polyisoprenoid-binding protein YceI
MSVTSSPKALLTEGTWRIDPSHSTLGFRVRHLMFESVRGRFLDFDGAIEAGDDVSIVGAVRAASVETHQPERDAHLRSPDFLDVERHPEIVFASSSVALFDDGSAVVLGDLTIKGVERPVALAGTYDGGTGIDGGERIAFELRGELNRLDFGLTWNRLLDTGGLVVGNTVELVLDVAAARELSLERAA